MFDQAEKYVAALEAEDKAEHKKFVRGDGQQRARKAIAQLDALKMRLQKIA